MKIKQEKAFNPSIITIETNEEYSALAFILTSFIFSSSGKEYKGDAIAREKAIELRDLLSTQHQ
jgi:hypothetical protein